MQISPPQNMTELYQRCARISGLTLGELAEELNIQVPENLKRHKGWGGQLLEVALGASAGNQACQDFPHLGIELKTLPVNRHYQPLETTYVCVAPLYGALHESWQNCAVRNKLSCVLWIPILAERNIAVRDRQIGTPFLWTPTGDEEQQLQQDWEEITERITLGEVETITAHLGEVLQLRPKAANNRALTPAIGRQGTRIETLPRGFYLKKEFTQNILKHLFLLKK